MTVHEFPHRKGARMATPVSCRDHLDQANSEREVLILVRDYVARLDSRDLAMLPAECRPGKFFAAEDVSGFALDLMRHHFTYSVPGAPVALDLIAFFSHAAQRLSEIAGSANDKDHQGQIERPRA